MSNDVKIASQYGFSQTSDCGKCIVGKELDLHHSNVDGPIVLLLLSFLCHFGGRVLFAYSTAGKKRTQGSQLVDSLVCWRFALEKIETDTDERTYEFVVSDGPAVSTLRPVAADGVGGQ